MLRFFRLIRQRLIEEGQIRKYLLYAIGEILLVMIGILLALQVNNWNEERKRAIEEQQILFGLEELCLVNQRELDVTYQRNLNAYQSSLKLMELVRPESSIQNTTYIDSLIAIFLTPQSFDPSSGALEDLLNSGKLGILSDKKLRDQVSSWSGAINDVEDDDKLAFDYLFSQFIPFLIRHTNFKNTDRFSKNHVNIKNRLPVPSSNFPSDYSKLMTSREFENYLYTHAYNMDFVLLSNEKMKDYLDETLELIQKNIDNND